MPPPTTFPSPTPLPPTPLPTSPPPTPLPPTPGPTINPVTVAHIVAEGQARLRAADIQPLCLRWEDTDGDETSEWVGMYHQPGEPPQLMAFVLDGEAWYNLQPLEGARHGLGQYPTCELDVRDINADGRVEILIWGYAEASTTLLHIFVWDGATYALLASFEGEAGIRLENRDGDLADEVAVRYHVDSWNGLTWEAVHTWDGANYGWTWERYTWFYLDRPHAYRADRPKHAVISFYLAIDDRDIPAAYTLLSDAARAAQPYEAWAVGYVTTVGVEVGLVHEIARGGDTARVTAQVRAYDNVDGRILATLWDVEWTVVQTSAGWRLVSATANQLDRWEAEYYP